MFLSAKTTRFVVRFAATLFVAASPSYADFVTNLDVSTSTEPNGSTKFLYTLSNPSDSDYNVYVFSVAIDPSADPKLITGPSGWNMAYTPGDSIVIWASSDPLYDLLPGQTDIFSFKSKLGGVLNDYIIQGIDESASNFEQDTGQIASPGIQAVPEPTSMIPLGTGLAAIGGYSLRRRGKAEDHPADSD